LNTVLTKTRFRLVADKFKDFFDLINKYERKSEGRLFFNIDFDTSLELSVEC
jgi:hypothetical protein